MEIFPKKKDSPEGPEPAPGKPEKKGFPFFGKKKEVAPSIDTPTPKGGSPLTPTGLESIPGGQLWTGASKGGSPIRARGASLIPPGISERFRRLKGKDLAFIAAGLSTLIMAPMAEYLMTNPENPQGAMQPGFDQRGSMFPTGGNPYEPGVDSAAVGGPPGLESDVITPLNVRDPSALIIGANGQQQAAQPSATVPPPARREDKDKWKDAITAAKAGTQAAVARTPLPRPSGKLGGTLRGLAALTGGGTGPAMKLEPPTSRGLLPGRGGGGPGRAVPGPGFRGAGGRSLYPAGGAGDRRFNPGAVGGGANLDVLTGGAGTGSGTSEGRNSTGDQTTNPGGSLPKEIKVTVATPFDNLALLRAKLELEKSIALKWDKKRYDELDRKKMFEQIATQTAFQTAQQAFLKILDKLLEAKKAGDKKGGDKGGAKPPGGGTPPGATAGSPPTSTAPSTTRAPGSVAPRAIPGAASPADPGGSGQGMFADARLMATAGRQLVLLSTLPPGGGGVPIGPRWGRNSGNMLGGTDASGGENPTGVPDSDIGPAFVKAAAPDTPPATVPGKFPYYNTILGALVRVRPYNPNIILDRHITPVVNFVSTQTAAIAALPNFPPPGRVRPAVITTATIPPSGATPGMGLAGTSYDIQALIEAWHYKLAQTIGIRYGTFASPEGTATPVNAETFPTMLPRLEAMYDTLRTGVPEATIAAWDAGVPAAASVAAALRGARPPEASPATNIRFDVSTSRFLLNNPNIERVRVVYARLQGIGARRMLDDLRTKETAVRDALRAYLQALRDHSTKMNTALTAIIAANESLRTLDPSGNTGPLREFRDEKTRVEGVVREKAEAWAGTAEDSRGPLASVANAAVDSLKIKAEAVVTGVRPFYLTVNGVALPAPPGLIPATPASPPAGVFAKLKDVADYNDTLASKERDVGTALTNLLTVQGPWSEAAGQIANQECSSDVLCIAVKDEVTFTTEFFRARHSALSNLWNAIKADGKDNAKNGHIALGRAACGLNNESGCDTRLAPQAQGAPGG